MDDEKIAEKAKEYAKKCGLEYSPDSGWVEDGFIAGYSVGYQDGQADATRRETPPEDDKANLLGGRQ